MKDISKSNGLRHESSCQSDGGEEGTGIVNKVLGTGPRWPEHLRLGRGILASGLRGSLKKKPFPLFYVFIFNRFPNRVFSLWLLLEL